MITLHAKLCLRNRLYERTISRHLLQIFQSRLHFICCLWHCLLRDVIVRDWLWFQKHGLHILNPVLGADVKHTACFLRETAIVAQRAAPVLLAAVHNQMPPQLQSDMRWLALSISWMTRCLQDDACKRAADLSLMLRKKWIT